MRIRLALPIAVALSQTASADPARDLIGKSYQVETTQDGAINVGIDFNRVGYGVIAPGRTIPATGSFPAYRIETLADDRGVSIIVAARAQARVSPTVEEWLVTGIVEAPKVSSDSNLSYTCPGNSDTGAAVQFVYYDDQPKGRTLKKIADGFVLDRSTGRLAGASKPPQGCKATEDPL
jgi:hypothetical protein